jgi:prevent-host-death family protein
MLAAWPYTVVVAQFSVAEAKVRFSELVQRAMLGEDIIVAKANRAVVNIVPIKPARRKPGTGRGIWIWPTFDGPLEDFQEYT